MPGRRAPLASRLRGHTTTIFAEMSELAAATGSINLGQGFPDTDGDRAVAAVAVAAIEAGANQYAPGAGVASLREAVAAHQRAHYGIELDPATEVLVTCGATEGIAAAMLALLEPGDEVVMFEPSYDSYAAAVAMAGGRRRVVTLEAPGWGFDPAALEAAVGPRTRLLLLNSPHNPTGKVFDQAELAAIAELCVRHDLLAVTDEVYEHLVFAGAHRPLSCCEGMAARTLTISSAGKTFAFTGWKVGWVSGPAPMVAAVRAAKQFLTYATPAPFQLAIAAALDAGATYIDPIRHELALRRDQFCDGLAARGWPVVRPAATYFATTDVAATGEDAVTFCRALPERCGVVAVPSSFFYEHPGPGANLVRWAFCKRAEVLDDALGRLGDFADVTRR